MISKQVWKERFRFLSQYKRGNVYEKLCNNNNLSLNRTNRQQSGKKYITYRPKTGSEVTIREGDTWLSRTAYEAIPNEKHHYSPITVTAPGDYYMVKTAFLNGDIPYAAGQQIDKDTYDALSQSDKDNKIDVYTFVLPTEENAGSARTNPQKVDSESNPVIDEDGNPVYEPITYYYCRNSYYVNEKGEVRQSLQ